MTTTNHSLKVNDEYKKYFGYFKYVVKVKNQDILKELEEMNDDDEKEEFIRWCKKEFKVRVYDLMGVMVYTDADYRENKKS